MLVPILCLFTLTRLCLNVFELTIAKESTMLIEFYPTVVEIAAEGASLGIFFSLFGSLGFITLLLIFGTIVALWDVKLAIAAMIFQTMLCCLSLIIFNSFIFIMTIWLELFSVNLAGMTLFCRSWQQRAKQNDRNNIII